MMKRRRTSRITEQDIDNKKRLTVSQFEDLPNDLIYEIFDYFDYISIYEIFLNLNSRFQSLLSPATLPVKINFPLISKSIFQYRCTHIITPNIHRIISLNISKYFLESFSLTSFSSLESLSIHDLSFNKILTLLSHLIALPRLFSLSLHSSDYFQDDNSVYLAIFCLSKLKFCKLTFSKGGERVPLPFASNLHQTFERLIIDGPCRLDQLIAILSYLPTLQHFSCRYLYGSISSKIQSPMNLTSICFTTDHIPFNEMKLFLMNVGVRLKKLRMKILHINSYLYAEQWEELISNHMPCLCVFDLQYSVTVEDDSYQVFIDRFSSKFWIERNWFFDYYYFKYGDSICLTFFSIVPYRYDHFTLYDPVDDNQLKSYQNPHVNFARHLIIKGYQRPTKFNFQFPRVTKLTMAINNVDEETSFIDDMTAIVPLQQITDLHMKVNDFSLIQILYHLPHLQSLTLSDIPPLESHPTEMITLNKITKLIIDDDYCQLKHVHLLIDIFPYLEYLEINLDEHHLEEILYVLLTKLKHLFSLLLLNVVSERIEKIQTFINKEKLLDNYTSERIRGGLFLWW